MIQRKQNLHFLSVILLTGILFFVPLFEIRYIDCGSVARFMHSNRLALILGILNAALALISLALFKSPRLQTWICYMAMLPSVLFPFCIFTLSSFALANPENTGSIHFLAGTWLTFLYPVLFLAAAIYIRRTRKQVKAIGS